ncbi:MAG: AAA family ATPase [Bryobacteraceae bacterium]|jgi:predicted ATPase
MITKVEASGYRCLREVSQDLQPYQILVGPNGSGKSAFLDVIAFLGGVVSRGLKEAVRDRTENFYDLVWGRTESSFRLAIEATRPEVPEVGRIRYEITAEIDADDDEIVIASERLTVRDAAGQRLPVIIRNAEQVSFSAEVGAEKFAYELHPNSSSFTMLSPLAIEKTGFPSAVWLKSLLQDGVKTVALDNELLRAPSPPGAGRPAVYDGSNLARLVAQVQDSSPESFKAWVEHVQTAIADIADIRTVSRPEDRHRYLMIHYAGGVEVPQWMVSDGTLRLLALTLLAYLPGVQGVYLIEEPEVGVHPTAIETIIQSLSSVYEGQVIVTSHSPIVLSMPRPDQLLCFQKTQDGTTILPGNEHPLLKQWKSGVDLSDLFAAGVLG